MERGEIRAQKRDRERKSAQKKKMYKRKSETIKGKLKFSILTRLIMQPPFSPPFPQPLCLTWKEGKDECDMTAP